MSRNASKPSQKLSRLAAEHRQAILHFAREHPLLEILQWLAAGGPGRPRVVTTTDALSTFLAGSELQAGLDRRASAVAELLARARQAHLHPPADDELHDAGQDFFSGLALAQQDPRAWEVTQRLMLRRDQLRLSFARFKQERLNQFQDAIDAVAASFKANPDACALFHQAVDRLGGIPGQRAPPAPPTGELPPAPSS